MGLLATGWIDTNSAIPSGEAAFSVECGGLAPAKKKPREAISQGLVFRATGSDGLLEAIAKMMPQAPTLLGHPRKAFFRATSLTKINVVAGAIR